MKKTKYLWIILFLSFATIFLFFIVQLEKKAISFGLYGSNPLYTLGALKNAELAPKFYPGWTVVFYVDEKTVPPEIIAGLKERRAVVVTEGPYNDTLFGRLTIADDKRFDRFIVRDADSRPSKREAKAVEEWIQSGKKMHNIRDHEYHNTMVMGGLWGGKTGFLKGHKMQDLISNWLDKSEKGQDQFFLAEIVVPIVGIENLLSHDSYHCKTYPNSIPFPRPDSYKDFAWQVYKVDEKFHDIAVSSPGKNGPRECNPSLSN